MTAKQEARNGKLLVTGSYVGGPALVRPEPPRFTSSRVLTLDGTGGRALVEVELPRTEVTHELWFKTTDPEAGLFSAVSMTTHGGHDRHLYLHGGELSARVWDNEVITASGINLADGTWHHLAHVIGGSAGGQRLYVDGILRAKGQKDASAFDWQTHCTIGYSQDAQHRYLNGSVTEVRIWAKARSVEEVRRDMHMRLGGGERGLFCLWPLNDSEPTVRDLALGLVGDAAPKVPPKRHAGTVDGNAQWTTDVLPFDDRRCLGFDTVSSLEMSGFEGSRLSGYTLEAWIRPDEQPGSEWMPAMALTTATTTSLRHAIRLHRDGSLLHVLEQAGKSQEQRAGTIVWGEWIHLAITCEGQSAYIHLNGQRLGNPIALSSPVDIEPALLFGRDWQSSSVAFQGQMAEVRLWSEALSPTAIQAGMRRRPSPAETGLAGWWPLDESGGDDIWDLSNSGRHTKLGNCYRARSGVPFDDALTFEGSKAHVVIAHHTDIDFTGETDFTVEAWVRSARRQKDLANGDNDVIEKWNGASGYPYVIRYRNQSGGVVAARYPGGTPYPVVRSTTTIHDGGFHHIAFVKQKKQLILYLDAVEENRADDTTGGRVGNTSPLYLGCRGGQMNFFHGEVTELRFWRRALAVDELWAKMRRRAGGDEPGLVGYWPLGASSQQAAVPGIVLPVGAVQGTTREDADMPLLAATTAEPPTAPAPRFNGTSSRIVVRASDSLRLDGPMTVEAWVRPDRQGGDIYRSPVIEHHGSASGWALRCHKSTASFMLTLDGRHHEVMITSTSMADTWVHLAGTYDGKTLQLYVNGVAAVGARKTVSGTFTPYRGDLNIGRNPYWLDRLFAGQVSEARLWRRCRSAEEIQRYLFRRLPIAEGDPAPADLVGYWQLNEGENQSVVVDNSGRGHNGTLANVQWVASDLPPRLPEQDLIELTVEEKLARAEAKLADAEERLDAAQKEMGELQGQVETLRQNQVKAQTEFDAELERRTLEFDESLAEKDAKIADLERQQAEQLVGEFSIKDIYTNALDNVEKARQEIEARGGTYRLGDVTVDMKYVALDGGKTASFPKVEENVASERFTVHHMEFSPRKQTEVVKSMPRAVPNLSQFTETMAKRKLSEAGFLVEVYSRAVTRDAGDVDLAGRVVDQIPAAGTEAASGGTVLIFIGKES